MFIKKKADFIFFLIFFFIGVVLLLMNLFISFSWVSFISAGFLVGWTLYWLPKS